MESDRRNLWKREEKRLERVIGKLKSLLDNVSFKIQWGNIILYLYSSGFWLIEIIIKKRKMIIMFYLSLFFIS